MSGGSYDYACFRVEEFAEALRKTDEDPGRVAFKELLILVAKAMREIEWVDSGDKSDGDEYESIQEVMAFLKSDPKTIIKARSYDKLAEKLKRYLDLSEK